MKKFIIENWDSITTIIVAIIAGIVIPLYLNRRRITKIKKPESIVNNVTYVINIEGHHNHIGEIYFSQPNDSKLLGSGNYKKELDLNLIADNFLKNQHLNTDDQLLNFTLEVLKQFHDKIPTLFYNHEHHHILNLVQDLSFKYKVKKLLFEIFINPQYEESERYDAGLFLIYLVEDDSSKLFLSGELEKLNPFETENENSIIEFFFHIVNIGYLYHSNSFQRNSAEEAHQFNAKFKDKFDSVFNDRIVHRFILSDNENITLTAALALVWLIDGKAETKETFWQPNDETCTILIEAFAKAKQKETIRSLLLILHKLNIDKCVFKDNFAYECAFCIDNDLTLQNKVYEPINVELTNLIYSKYIQSPEPIKNILIEYLAKYGYLEVSIANRLLELNLKQVNSDFVLFVLLPYLNNINDKGIVSFVIEWLNSNNEKINFYGLLFQKSIEKVANEIVKLFKDNRYAMAVINNSNNNINLPSKKGVIIKKLVNILGHHSHKIRAKDTTGRWALYVLLVNPYVESKLIKAIEGNGTIDLSDFGVVLASKYGDKFPDDMDSFMHN